MTRHGSADAAVSIGKWVRNLSRGKIVRKLTTPTVLTSTVLALVAAAAVYISVVNSPGPIGVLGAGLALVMLAIAYIDWRSFIIPDWLNVAGGGLAILHAAAREPEAMLQAVAMAVLRGVMLAAFFLLLRYGYARLRGRQGLGFGDVKLAFVAGAWLDWLTIPIAIQLAAFAALTSYVSRQIVSGGSISAVNRIPFGLFFAPAIWICWVLAVAWLDPL